MPTDEMTPERAAEQAAMVARTRYRDEQATWPEPLRSVTRADLDAGIAAARADWPAWSEAYEGDGVAAIFQAAVNRRAYRIQQREPKASATRQVMAAFGVGERAAVRLLDSAGAPREGRRYIYDTATRARIAHTVTARALRQLIANTRQPQTRREYRSAQEYARRRVPVIRPEVLTGMALEQAILSIEAAAPSLFQRFSDDRAKDQSGARDVARGERAQGRGGMTSHDHNLTIIDALEEWLGKLQITKEMLPDYYIKGDWRGDMHRKRHARKLRYVRNALRQVKGEVA